MDSDARLDFLMTPSPLRVEGDTPLLRCAEMLHKADVRHLPVVEQGVLVGLVSDVEVFGRVGLTRGEEAWVVFGEEACARELMTCAETARPDDEVGASLERLCDDEVDSLVVVDDEGTPVGIVTEHDGLRLVADGLREQLQVVDIAQAEWAKATPQEDRRTGLGRLVAARRRHLLVCEGDDLQGVVSVRDLAGAGPDIRLNNLMSRPVTTVPPHTPAVEVARLMLRDGIGVVPVVGDQGVVGVVDRSGLIAALVRQPPREAERTL